MESSAKKSKSWFKSKKQSKDKKEKKDKEKKPKVKKKDKELVGTKKNKSKKLEKDNEESNPSYDNHTSDVASTSTSNALSEFHVESVEDKIQEPLNITPSGKKILRDDDSIVDSSIIDRKEFIDNEEKSTQSTESKSSSDKRIEDYYVQEDVDRVKEAIKAIEQGIIQTPKNLSDNSKEDKQNKVKKMAQMFQTSDESSSNTSLVAPPRQFNSNNKFPNNSNMITKSNPTQTFPRVMKEAIDVRSGINEKEYVVPLRIIRLEEIGHIKMTRQTTFSMLREQLTKKASSNFVFQDLSTKRPIGNESRKVLSTTSNVVVAEKSADLVLGDAAIHGTNSFGAKDGSFAFKVLWWDNHFHNNHQVWLKFDAGRITVSGTGGSFKLFDHATLRVPLVFATVKGSERAFQFLRNKGSTLASRFYAVSKEQRQAIGVFFCFVWRPQAVRRGWMPKLYSDPTIETAGEIHDPKKFVDLLKRHSIEIVSIINEVEKKNDPNLVRKYFNLFASMFSGGYTALTDRELMAHDEFRTGSLKNRLENWHNLTNNDPEKPKELLFGRDEGNQKAPRSRQVQEDEYDDFLLGDEELNFTESTSQPTTNDVGSLPPPPVVYDGNGPPPPPPPPPPGQAVPKKPSILPLNFDEILSKDINGTIWGSIDGFGLPESTLSKLENELKIIFGKDARSSNLENKEEKGLTVLEFSRLQNIEILMRMDELKGLNFDDFIDGILSFDPRIFQINVLERLVRKVGTGDNKVHAFLPTDKEIQLLNEHKESNKTPLTDGEVFFKNLATLVPDRVERLEYSFFIHKVQEDYNEISEQVHIINEAIEAVRGSEKLKSVLKLILEIINVLNPKTGNTRGFKISTFIPKVERAHGAVANPNPKKPEESQQEEISTEGKTKEEIRREKLERLRKKKHREEDEEAWKVLLLEYLTVYTAKYKECQFFWRDFMEPCQAASCIDMLSLDGLSLSWMTRSAEITEFVKDTKLPSSDPFIMRLNEFLKEKHKLEELRDKVEQARTGTENLWGFFGEKVDTEPQMIYKYLHEFGATFEKYFKEMNAKDTKILILKGQLPLLQHKVKEKKVEKKTVKTTKSKGSKFDELRKQIESRTNAEEDVAEGQTNKPEIEPETQENPQEVPVEAT